MGRQCQVIITAVIEDIMDTDPMDDTGISEDAFDRINAALTNEGFTVQTVVRDRTSVARPSSTSSAANSRTK